MRRRGVVLGFGHFGKTHVEVVGDLVRIVGVYSRTREKAERVLAYKAHADCKVFWGETIDPCLEWAQENGVDFVLVLLPIPLLHMAVTACLKRVSRERNPMFASFVCRASTFSRRNLAPKIFL